MKVIYGFTEVNGNIVRRPIVLEEKKCSLCGSVFQPKRQDSEHCSRICQKRAEYKRNSEKRIAKSSEYYHKNLEEVKKRRKEYYHKNPEHWKAKAKEWRLKNLETASKNRKEWNDKVRHDGKREELIKEHGYICFSCGKESTSFDIVAHHSNFNPNDHSEQELLCRSCHCILHHWSQ